MKTTFKKTMAALSAAAVVATSAAVMAMPTSAALSGTAGVANVNMTLAELKAANYEVELDVTSSTAFVQYAFGITIGDGLTYIDADADKGTCAAALVGDFVWYPIIATKDIAAGRVGYIKVKVTESAKEGDVFKLTASAVSATGGDAVIVNAAGDEGVMTVSSGSITIVAAETEATTEAPTEGTTAPVATGTTEVTTTTTKKAASSASPKTGDALPVAGVAVAVAVIGGVALVSKKRK